MSRLTLDKPLIFFDLETTGTNVSLDRIVEISLLKLAADGSIVVRETRRVNPERPIPAEASAVHHITDADVASCPTFAQIAGEVLALFDGCDIAGYNSNRFDVPMLDNEMRRAGLRIDLQHRRFVDVQTIFHKKEQRTLSAAYKFYCGKNLEDAHTAEADTMATYEVLLAQLEHYPDLPGDIEGLAKFSTQKRNVDLMGRLVYDDQGHEVLNFGQYKGQLAEDILRNNPGYYSWIMRGDFTQDTKDAFTRINMRLRKKN